MHDISVLSRMLRVSSCGLFMELVVMPFAEGTVAWAGGSLVTPSEDQHVRSFAPARFPLRWSRSVMADAAGSSTSMAGCEKAAGVHGGG